jgi:broad specificity phosphatase PhoE
VGIIHLVRHGQASFQAEDYDQLSELGAAQARHLGASWARAGRPVDALFTGPRRRQIDSARHLLEAAHAAGARYPDPIVVDELDEVPFREIVKAELQRRRAPGGARAPAHTPAEKLALLHGALRAWADGQLAPPDCESFDRFAARIDGVLTRLARAGAALAVTSAGPIAAALRLARAPGTDTPGDTMQRAIGLANASVSTFSHADGALTLEAVNVLQHLEPDLVTYI